MSVSLGMTKCGVNVTMTSSAVVPMASCSTLIQVVPLAAPMIDTPSTWTAGCTCTGLLSSCLTPLPSAESNKLLWPGSVTPLTTPFLSRPLLVGKSSTPELGRVGLAGGRVSKPCSLGVDPPGRSSVPLPLELEIRLNKEGRDKDVEEEAEEDRREARVCWTVEWRSCFQEPGASGSPFRCVSR